MDSYKKLITLIIPAYNEEEVLDQLYEDLVKLREEKNDYRFEFLFINDGSSDNTLEMIKKYREKDPDVSYINLSRNFGKEIAMVAGLDYAQGDAIVFLDADLQDPPELIHEFIKYWEEGYDDVYAQRKNRDGETWFKKFSAKMYYRLINKMTNVPIQIDTGDFRLLDRRVVNALKKAREESRTMKSLLSWVGYKKKAVFFDRKARAAGKTKWSYSKLFNLAIDGITSLTITPLKIASIISIPTTLAFIIYFIIVLIGSFIKGVGIQLEQIIILLILFFGTLQIIFIGIIGEYLGRTFIQTLNRPLYLVDEYNGEKEKNE